MKLKEFLEGKGIKITEASHILGVNRVYLGRICNGKSFPSFYLAREISEMTEGKVSVEDLMPPKRNREVCKLCKQKLPKKHKN